MGYARRLCLLWNRGMPDSRYGRQGNIQGVLINRFKHKVSPAGSPLQSTFEDRAQYELLFYPVG